MRLLALLAVVAFFALANVVAAGTYWLLGILAAATDTAQFAYTWILVTFACAAAAVLFMHGVIVTAARLSKCRARARASSRPAPTTTTGRSL